MYDQPAYINEKLRKFLHAMAAEEGGIRDRMAVSMREIYSLNANEFPDHRREQFRFLQDTSKSADTAPIEDLKKAVDYAFCLKGDVADALAEARFRDG